MLQKTLHGAMHTLNEFSYIIAAKLKSPTKERTILTVVGGVARLMHSSLSFPGVILLGVR